MDRIPVGRGNPAQSAEIIKAIQVWPFASGTRRSFPPISTACASTRFQSWTSEPDGPDGILKFSDGQIYRGFVRKGLREGSGTNRWQDGQDYTGEWKHNSRNGRGTHTWPDGRKVTGEWKEGHLHGKVYFSWPNGATFDGSCRMGKKHGRGTLSNRLWIL